MSVAVSLRRSTVEISVPRESEVELESVDCLLCGSADSQTAIIASDPTTGIGGKFRVVRCIDCGLHYTNPRPTMRSLGQFYPDDYNPYQGREWKENLAARFGRRLERAVLETYFGYPRTLSPAASRALAALGLWKFPRSRQRQSWIPWRDTGRLLDFGCGAGGFLQEMREFGWQAEGLDFSEKVANEVMSKTGIPVHVGTLPHPGIEPGSFDCVTMWNSLEHVPCPRTTVKSAGSALRTGGVLVIGVPNIDSWGYRTFQENWHGLELPRHLVHFTPATLHDLLEREGFRVLLIDQIARDGWIRRSARRAVKSGRAAGWMRYCPWKPVGLQVSNWTERTGQADFIRAVAEKR